MGKFRTTINTADIKPHFATDGAHEITHEHEYSAVVDKLYQLQDDIDDILELVKYLDGKDRAFSQNL